MAGGFKRSSRFGLIGVVVVAIVVAVIAQSSGSGEANPKGTLAVIFGVIAVFFVILFILQRSDLERVAGGNVRAVERAAAEGGGRIENPTTMAEQDLWAALAIKPIGAEAIRARSQVWDSSRRSLRLGMVVTLLIFLTVPSIYLFESFVPLLIGGPLIAIAVYGSIRAIGPGGEVSKAFDSMDQAMQPLGLSVVRRPQIRFETREPSMPGFSARLSGPTVLDGERHGRTVSVQIGGHEDAGVTEVVVAATTPEFSARSSDGRIKPGEGAPAAIETALKSIPNSTRWKKLTVKAEGRGIVVTRKGGEQVDWLCDLWLAERLAEAA